MKIDDFYKHFLLTPRRLFISAQAGWSHKCQPSISMGIDVSVSAFQSEPPTHVLVESLYRGLKTSAYITTQEMFKTAVIMDKMLTSCLLISVSQYKLKKQSPAFCVLLRLSPLAIMLEKCTYLKIDSHGESADVE